VETRRDGTGRDAEGDKVPSFYGIGCLVLYLPRSLDARDYAASSVTFYQVS